MNNKLLYIFVFFLSITPQIYSKHIIGGEIFYTCLGVNSATNSVRFKFTMNIYRDCSSDGAGFDSPTARVGIYKKDDSGLYNYILTDNWKLINIEVVKSNNPCVIQPPSVCVEKGTYEYEVALPIITGTYVVAYQRCCRNESITNILTPGSFGAAYTVEISPEAQKVCNNSPTFKNFPPIIICNNQPIDFDHAAIDQDGDQIKYEFCTPYHAGGQRGSAQLPGDENACDGVTPDPSRCLPPFRYVIFKAPLFSTQMPLAGNPVVSIDNTSGFITGIPTLEGQYVIGVCIKEYRNGVLLSVVQRDFQFNVFNCTKAIQASISSDSIVSNDKYIINACGDNTVNLINTSTIESNIKRYDWEFIINGQTKTFNTKNVSLTLPGLGKYKGYLYLNKGDGQCSDTSEIDINVFPGISAEFQYSFDSCTAGSIQFNDDSKSSMSNIISWKYNFETNQNSNLQNPQFEFKTPGIKDIKLLIRDNNGCKDSITKQLRYFPVPALIVLDPSIFNGCQPLDVLFRNLSYPIDSSYSIQWEFGDGNTSNAISPFYTYQSEGIFTVHLNITSPIGCKTSITYPNWISVLKSPNADFDFTPEKLSNFNNTITLSDQSSNSELHKYIFDDKITRFERNLNYSFSDTGIHKITQIVSRLNSCSDTLIQYIDMEPVVTYFIPNAYTPNGDGNNEQFYGIGKFWEWMSEFRMVIWDRWGGKVFETIDPNKGWNGRYDNGSIELEPGVYVYQIQYIAPRNKNVILKGFVNLIR
ncbi:MAG: gliding motility-associated C-terminal domain-containing protein [Saprospiraceae bacterium]|nr:gliding motility-associated C-terminal domain-containing protein [Saprospiraceae bacterium]